MTLLFTNVKVVNFKKKGGGKILTIFIRDSLCFENLTAIEKSFLFKPLVYEIKRFYQVPKNRQAYEKWLALKKSTEPPSTNTADFYGLTAPQL
jgi:hypothetical protein